MNWLKLPKKVYFKRGGYAVAVKEFADVYNFKRALIVTDAELYTSEVCAVVEGLINKQGIRTAEFFTAEQQPTVATALSGLPKMQEFEPDVIVAVGGCSIISLAKIMHLLYEAPEADIPALAAKYNKADDLELDYTFPKLGQKCKLVTVSAYGGSGAEFTPFAVIKDENGADLTVTSYQFIPEMAICDPEFSLYASPEATKASGLNVLSNAVRAFLSDQATDYTRGFAKDAVKDVFTYLDRAIANGEDDPEARINMMAASAIAGMAFGNACATIDPAAPAYPSEAEKDVANMSEAQLKLVVELCDYCGIDTGAAKKDSTIFGKWIQACEVLA